MKLKYLPKINSPSDIRDFSINELEELCDELRSYIINTVTEVGGHLAPTLGVIELSVALHYLFDTPKDKLVWDVGHQGYAHKILTGRFKEFSTIRQYKGISGFLKRSESEFDVFGAGHASTSISSALGIAEARFQKNNNFRVAAIIGDGSMTGGLAFEGINNAGHLGRQLLVILNDNEMSISPNVGAISKYFTKIISNPLYNKVRNIIWDSTGIIPMGKSTARALIKKLDETLKNLIVPGMLFQELGFRYFGPINGHDLSQVIDTLKNIKDIDSPVLLHILTKKGQGMLKKTNGREDYHVDAVKFHAVKPNGNNNKNLEIQVKEKACPIFQDVFGSLVCEIAEKRNDTICVTAAMREGTGLVEYSKRFPKRYYDVGIAEGHAVTFSAGLATEGFRPIVAIYSTFLQRAYDHIVHDVALQNLPVIFCLDRSGIAGEDGPTHHGALDIAYLRCVQNLILASPKDGNELRSLLYTALNIYDKPFAIRYPKASSDIFDQNGKEELIDIGSWTVEKSGSKVAILSVGSMVSNSVKAAKKLDNYGIRCEVVNCRFIKPMDFKYLKKMLNKFNYIFTVEEGTINGGFGDAVASYLLEHGFKGDFKKIGMPDQFVHHGPRNKLLSVIGLDENGISDFILEKYKEKANEKIII
ncbi:MAG: 1-deoxy-D-xylulose-5-phosphate synthase [Candidatus Marinimicrobia bacterium]|nr:1-deoxy-D-xylulose-5-phosphate synthase [Candidatus Neomarinimicrobiota bacterium]|tara:strand:+ start:825 stop:2756 length:1932 start_codon:yes stop_codon:yes gene_type:complete